MIEHLSPSQIGMYLRCSRQYEFRYIKGIIRPPSGAMVLGSAYDKGLSARFEWQIEKGEPPSPEYAVSVFSDTFEDIKNERKLEADEDAFEFEEIDWEEEAGSLKDTGVALLGTYQKTVAPHVTPVTVQCKDTIILSTEEGEIPVVIVPDLTTDIRTVDHKVKKKAFSSLELSQNLQATVYPMSTGLPLEFHVAKKTKTPQIDVQPTHRVYADQIWFVDQTTKIWRAIRAGIFVPNNQGWWCCPDWCGYYGICQGGA